MQRVQDFQSPTPQAAQEVQFQDEWTPRYGILVGGVKEIAWNGIGEQCISTGDQTIYRRVWKPFMRIQVGRRNEFDGALDMPMNAIQADWAKSSERIVSKSPRACASDVLASHKERGYCVPTVLIGHADPQSLSEKVWPRALRDSRRLFEHIAYFESFKPTTEDEGGEDETRLAAELLEACYTARNYISEYVRMLKTEINAEKGLKNLNANLEELFAEIGEPLPEQKTALVAQAMGKEIVNATRPDGRKDDAIIGALNAITDRLVRLEEKEPEEVSAEANAAPVQPSKSSTKRRAPVAEQGV